LKIPTRPGINNYLEAGIKISERRRDKA